MAQFRDHFSGTVRSSKDEILHGPLSVRRVNATPPNDFGRNGDMVIVDNTADESERIAINRVPVAVQLCQKIPLIITAGTFTITTPDGVFSIVITSLDDIVAEINRANIPGFNASNDPRGNITINDIGSVWADGTSDFPSVSGNVGAQAGTYVIGMGTWECFPVGSFGAESYGVITGDVGSAVSLSASELITFTGVGNTITATNSGIPGGDVISFDMDVADLPPFSGILLPTDEIAINNSGTTERITVSKFLEDIDIPVIPGTGIVVKTGSGPDVWATRTITASAVAGDEGISVVDGDGVAGNPTIGVDITGQVAAGAEMGVTDEFLGFDGTNNVKFTGQEIADGVSSIIGGVATTVIDGEIVPTFIDTTRADKILSIETVAIPWARNKLNNDTYLKANGDANDADAGWVCPHTATLVKATGVAADDDGNTKDINLYVNGLLDTASILSFSPTASGQNTDRDVTINIDVSQDDVIHLRGSSTGGEIKDVAVTLFFKWRG